MNPFFENKGRMPSNAKACMWYPVCPMKRYYEKGVLDAYWVTWYCHENWRQCVRFKMEAAGEAHPDWMLPDGRMDDRLRGEGTV